MKQGLFEHMVSVILLDGRSVCRCFLYENKGNIEDKKIEDIYGIM